MTIPFWRHCEPTGPAEGRPEDRLREAIPIRFDGTRGLRLLAGLGDCGGPWRHHIADAVIEPVLTAHDEVGAGEALRPHGVLDQGGATAGGEPIANRLGEAAVDRDAGLAADVAPRLVRRLLGGHREIDDAAGHL